MLLSNQPPVQLHQSKLGSWCRAAELPNVPSSLFFLFFKFCPGDERVQDLVCNSVRLRLGRCAAGLHTGLSSIRSGADAAAAVITLSRHGHQPLPLL